LTDALALAEGSTALALELEVPPSVSNNWKRRGIPGAYQKILRYGYQKPKPGEEPPMWVKRVVSMHSKNTLVSTN
jgi:hypothetical protein